MRDDLVGGIKNALERGATLEEAIRSFINAGYREADIREAARQLETGVAAFTTASQPVSATTTAMQPVALRKPLPVARQPPMQPQLKPATFEVRSQRQRPSLLIIGLVIVLVLSVAGFIMSLLFKTEIAKFFSNIAG